MKRVKKNQVIITALAIMIAVAGYINYAGNISDIISVSSKSGSKVVNTSTDDTIFTEEEPDDESLEEPGSVILTSGQGVSSSVISEAKLNREQIRAKNTENLTNIVNDTAIDKASKTEAINELAKIAEYSEKEAAIELLLEAKGFNDVAITRSAPLIINVPVSVIIGKSPMKRSCSLISPVSLLTSWTLTCSGAE